MEKSSFSREKVLPYKFFAPTAYPNAVRRTAILHAIRRNPLNQIVCIQAPAGHGKSTSLQQMLHYEEERHSTSGWLTLDDADNELGRFLSYFYALIKSVVGRSRYQPEGTLSTEDSFSHIEQIIAIFISTDKNISLFFDEFQCLNSAAVLKLFERILERLPANVRIFIGSRTVPDIGLPRLIAHNKALLITADMARFTIDETKSFFTPLKELQLSEAEMEVIHRQTEGWPAAIQLVKLALEAGAEKNTMFTWVSSQLPQFAEYLADNILRFQSAEIREFLQHTSMLKRVSSDVCNEITGRQNSQEILLQLERQGLFLRRIGSDGSSFKYHSLFASYVEQSSQLTDEQIKTIHTKAFRWFKSNGYMEEAMHHAVTSMAFDLACEVLDQWSVDLVSNAYLSTVIRWFNKIPIEALVGRPALQVRVAWALLFLRVGQSVWPILKLIENEEKSGDVVEEGNVQLLKALTFLIEDDFEKSYQLTKEIELPPFSQVDGFAAFEYAAASNMMGIFMQAASRFEEAKEYLSRGRAYSDLGSASFSWAYSLAILGMTHMTQGHLRDALKCFSKGTAQRSIFTDESFASASLIAAHAQALYEINDLDIAEAYLQDSIQLISKAALPDWLAIGYVTLSQIYFAKGDSEAANEILEEGENIALEEGLIRVAKSLLWEKSRQCLLANDSDSATEISEQISNLSSTNRPEGWFYYSDDTSGNRIGRIRLAIYTGELKQAANLLGDTIKEAKTKGRGRRLIKLLILDAIINHRTEKITSARRSMIKALEMGAPEGFLRIFSDEGDQAMAIIADISRAYSVVTINKSSELTKKYMLEILKAGNYDPVESIPKAMVGDCKESLTYREVQILTLLAEGESNKHISEHLFISANTVKFHLKNIYVKLGISNRTEAASMARGLDVFENKGSRFN